MATKHNPDLAEKAPGVTESTASVDSNYSLQNVLSQDDLRKLRRVSGPIPWTVYAVTVLEMAESLSLHGTLVVSQSLPNSNLELA